MPAATDAYARYTAGPGPPYSHAFAITPDDSNDLANATTALWVGGAGAIKLVTVGGETVTLAAVPVGLLPIRATRVWSTGTAATNLIGLY